MSPSCVVLLSKRARNSCASSAFVLGFCKSKRRSFFSFPPVITLVASESTATLRTIWPCVNVCKHSPVYVSHTLAEKSALPVTARAASPPLSLALHTALCGPRMSLPSRQPNRAAWDYHLCSSTIAETSHRPASLNIPSAPQVACDHGKSGVPTVMV